MSTSTIASTSGTTSTNTSSSQTATSKLAQNFDNFLKLLTTQLQYQDPLSPMDANQFTTQLVQFTQVEQSVKMNSQIENLIKVERASQALSAVTFIGTDVEAKGDQISFNGTDPLTWHYNLSKSAQSVTLSIENAQGRTVKLISGEKAVGRHDLIWDGKDSTGKVVPSGTYTLKVSATGENRALIDSSVTREGRVSAVSTTSDGIQLFLDDVQFSLDDVLTIRRSDLN
ncbi:MAG: flagellar hook capping FlgD N-terminal domain-containing protein [Alphaproteobacteria bacterium]